MTTPNEGPQTELNALRLRLQEAERIADSTHRRWVRDANRLGLLEEQLAQMQAAAALRGDPEPDTPTGRALLHQHLRSMIDAEQRRIVTELHGKVSQLRDALQDAGDWLYLKGVVGGNLSEDELLSKINDALAAASDE